MRTAHFLLLLLIVSILPQNVTAGTSPDYRFPDHPVMMHLSVASNGSFALIGITLSEYGNIPGYMCPIDSPDTYLSCRELSEREYLLIEVGNGLKYINLTKPLDRFNFTTFSVVPVWEKWYLEGVHYFPPYGFGLYTNASYTLMEYFPEEKRIGKPVRLPQIDSEVLFSLPDAMGVGGTVSNGSLVFSFPYTNETYSVPVEAFEKYLHLLNFTDSSGLNSEKLLELFRAVPFRGGILLYIPDYGLEGYTPKPHFTREYLLIGNKAEAYSPVLWVGHSGFVSFPNNASSGTLTEGLFPPIFYYHDGHLDPLLKLSLEVRTCAPEGYGWTFTCAQPVLKLPNGTSVQIVGDSSVPGVEVPPDNGRVYISIVHILPHYSPENFTFVDLCVNRREILHAEIGSSGTSMLNMPFPGLFSSLNGSWVYNRLSNEGLRDLCLYHWRPSFNETFLFDPVKLTLHPLRKPNNSTPRVTNRDESGFITAPTGVSGPSLEGVSQCVPLIGAASMVRGVKVGSGVLFYYPIYVTGIALKGHGWAVVWGGYSSNTPVALNDTCLAFYYSDGRITSVLKADTTVVNVPVGRWSVGLEVPYIDMKNVLNASLEVPSQIPPEEGGTGICGPAAIVGFSLVPLLLRRKRRG
ncbi:CGP-CTERM sorting domain-containing protein [Thermococcus sp.]